MVKRVVVLISGSGTNLQALIDAQNTPALPDTHVVLVFSNRKAAYGLERAAKAIPPIPTAYSALKIFLRDNPGKTRDDYDAQVGRIVMEAKPDIIVLAGFMHICGVEFFKEVTEEKRSVPVLNIHPALPGEFLGAMNAIQLAYEAFQRGEITKTGVNVHRATIEVDRGEMVIYKEVEMIKGESYESFEERMHKTEWEIIVKATAKVLAEEEVV